MAEAQREPGDAGWFEVGQIPEKLRMTTFAHWREGAAPIIQIKRQTHVLVDTARTAVDERLAPYRARLETLKS